MTHSGSSNLNEEQQEFYRRRFGERYVAVQQTPQLASRKERRKRTFKPRSER